ncbi:MAG: hypothetical protein MI807_03940 [Verrucomicrobiales bacterium]|nr:hypothetical protein [Verrucomicrobiales bacterium]
MSKLLILFLTFGVGSASAQTIDDLFPYVVPESYFEIFPAAKKFSKELGNEISIALIFNFGESVKNVSKADLNRLKISEDQAHATAIENLAKLAASQAVKMRQIQGPEGKPFLLFGGHWAAATCILLPHLHSSLSKRFESEEVCVSIPHRDALLAFPRGNSTYLAEMKKMIKDKERWGERRLTDELFVLTKEGIKELE